MRRWIGVLLAAGVTAGAIALPSSATHEQITLTVLNGSRIELPYVDDQSQLAQARFSWSPATLPGEGDNVPICWNGHFDRSQLASNRQPNEYCSSGSNGTMAATAEGASASEDVLAAGHYEVYVKRFTPCEANCFPPPPPHWNASNVAEFDAVDPCRLRLESFKTTGSHFPMLVGAPITCSVAVTRELRVSGEDGSSISLASPKLSSIAYNSYELPWAPMLQIGSRAASSDVKFSLKSRLGHFLAIAHTGAVMLISVSPASATIVHRRNVSRVRVTSGRVVALGMGWDFIPRADLVRYCGRKRPTMTCLSRIRYRYFTMKRGTSLRAKVLRAGQRATFRKAKSLASIVH
jgi:hypothetical protein